MPRTYQQLSEDERDTLAILFNRGRTLRNIARFLGRSHGTLVREIRRNTTPTGYRPHAANRLAHRRLSHSRRRPRLADPGLRQTVETGLRWGWSPEIIAGSLQQLHKRPPISHEAIYQWVYADARHLIPCLLRGHRRRRHRANIPWEKVFIPQRVSVHERPAHANDRSEPGHWEADLVIGSGRSAIQVAVERASRFTRLRILPDKSARESSQALKTIFSSVPALFRKSVTYDNGRENTLHLTLRESFGTRSFFCDPFHSWEKGTVENTNGLLRRFLPKKTNFDIVPEHYLKSIEFWLNHRPRKCLGFKTSAQAFAALPGALTG